MTFIVKIKCMNLLIFYFKGYSKSVFCAKSKFLKKNSYNMKFILDCNLIILNGYFRVLTPSLCIHLNKMVYIFFKKTLVLMDTNY